MKEIKVSKRESRGYDPYNNAPAPVYHSRIRSEYAANRMLAAQKQALSRTL